MMTPDQLSKYFDHTLLKASADKKAVLELCAQAKTHKFMSVCVNPLWVETAAEALSGSSVLVCTVVGFPLGATTTAAKVQETLTAVHQGAGEIDMVISIGSVKSGDWDQVLRDMEAVVEAAGSIPVKVILETCYLSDQEIQKACELAMAARARFVKTSTGFGTGGATVEHIRLMRKTVGDKMQVKASGGIRTLKDTMAMIEAGADRIGASAGVEIMAELAGDNPSGASKDY